MADTLTPIQRSARMALIRSRDTRPELVVRRLIFGMGFRYRLHDRRLPGRPDIVFRSRRKVIFVHGCFWHRHSNCKGNRLPKTRLDFWGPKLEQNKVRDAGNLRALRRAGWQTLIIWECEAFEFTKLERRIRNFLCKNPR